MLTAIEFQVLGKFRELSIRGLASNYTSLTHQRVERITSPPLVLPSMQSHEGLCYFPHAHSMRGFCSYV